MKKQSIRLPELLIVLGLAVFVVLVFMKHRPYDWRPSFDPKSDEPFGCELFDEYMQARQEGGYEVLKDLPDTLDPKKDAVIYSKYMIGSRSYYDEDSIVSQEVNRINRLVDFANKGGKVIVATTYIYTYGTDSLEDILFGYVDPHIYTGYFYPSNDLTLSIKKHKEYPQKKVDVIIRKDESRHPVYPFMLEGHIGRYYCKDYHQRVLSRPKTDDVEKGDEELAFRRRFKSKGEMLIASVPLFFTNYAVMDPEARAVTEHLLTTVQDRHVIRIMGINRKIPAKKKTVANKDEFMFLRSHPSLRWAMNITLGTFALFIFFMGRRRMRPIPVVDPPKNATFEFAKFMGSYHFRRRDLASLLALRYEELLQRMSDSSPTDLHEMKTTDLRDFLVARTQENPEEVLRLIQTVHRVQNNENPYVSQQSLMRLLDLVKRMMGSK